MNYAHKPTKWRRYTQLGMGIKLRDQNVKHYKINNLIYKRMKDIYMSIYIDQTI